MTNKRCCFICRRHGVSLYGIPSICNVCQGLKSSDVDNEKMRKERERDILNRIESLMSYIGDNGGTDQ